MKRKRETIRHRNAITELWNDGRSVSEIAHLQGLSVQKVNAYLESARAGYNHPRYMEHAIANKEAAKAARKAK